MSGFSSWNSILNALTASGYGQTPTWQKTKAINTAAGSRYSLWADTGAPAAGTYPGSALTASQCTSSTTGALTLTNATSPRKLFALAAAASQHSGSGTLYLWDRLLEYKSINHATATNTLTTVSTLPRYTTGVGVYAFLEVTSALGAGAHTATLNYTDQGGSAGASGAQTVIVSTSATGIPHSFAFFPLAAGDTGIKTGVSVVFSAGGTGTSCLVLAKLLAVIPIPAAGVDSVQDLVRGAQIVTPQIQDNACLMFTYLAATAGTLPSFSGYLSLCEN